MQFYGLNSLVTTAVCKFYILKKFTEMHFYEWSSFYAVFLCNSQILKLVPGTLWTAPSSRKNAEKNSFFRTISNWHLFAIFFPSRRVNYTKNYLFDGPLKCFQQSKFISCWVYIYFFACRRHHRVFSRNCRILNM